MHREAEAMLKLMDALSVDRAIVLGHSDGGSIGLIAAALATQRICGLILEAPHVYVEKLTVASIAQIGNDYRSSDLSSRLGQYHRNADQVFWSWNNIWLDRRFREWNIEGLLHMVTVPALLIQGVDDEYGTLDQLARIEAALPATRRVLLTDCGHSPHKDQPEAVLASVNGFIDQLSR
jgi:pimeloyl-ACP methyl ester carboxylesterase